jgi:hypothetical protein
MLNLGKEGMRTEARSLTCETADDEASVLGLRFGAGSKSGAQR